jgi:O-antigen/teichoic acid export membrane protein
MNVSNSVIKLFSGRLSATLVGFLGIVYFSRELGVSAMGFFFMFQAVVGVSSIFTDFGMRSSVEKRVSENNNSNGYLSTSIVIKAILALIVLIMAVVFSPLINSYIGGDITLLLVVAIVVRDFSHLFEQVLRGELRVGETALLRLVNKIVWVASSTILVINGFGPNSLIYGYILGLLSKLLLGMGKINTPIFAPVSKEHVLSLWNYGKYTIIPSLDQKVQNWMDILIIGYLLTSAAVGAYEISWRILTPIFLLTIVIGETIFPQVSSWNSIGNRDRIETMYSNSIKYSLVIIIPAIAGVSIFSEEILGIVFGEGFQAASTALVILFIGLIPRSFRAINGKVLQGIDQPRLVTYSSIVEILCNIALNILLITAFGIVGAAIGTSFAFLLGAIIRYYYLRNHLRLRINQSSIIWIIISTLVMSLLLLFIKSQIIVQTEATLSIVILFGAGIYGLLVLSSPPFRHDIRLFLHD